MSVADCFGLDDPESPLMSEAKAKWVRWCADARSPVVGYCVQTKTKYTSQSETS